MEPNIKIKIIFFLTVGPFFNIKLCKVTLTLTNFVELLEEDDMIEILGNRDSETERISKREEMSISSEEVL